MFTLLTSFALIDFYRNPKSGLFFSKRTKCNYLLHYFAYSLLRHLIVKKEILASVAPVFYNFSQTIIL